MTILDYTDILTIRALLGVNPIELRDATVMLPPYLLAVEEHLDMLSPALQPLFVNIKAMPTDSRNTLQTRLFFQVQTYSALMAAIEIMPSLPMAAPKSIGDGKAKLDRIADPYTALQESLKVSARVLAQRLLDTLIKLDPTTILAAKIIRNFAGVAPLAVDPVTGS